MSHSPPSTAATLARSAAGTGHVPTRTTWAPSLRDAFDHRANGLSLMRLALAVVVAISHGLENGFGWQPSVNGTQIGVLAVDGFFVISGYLMVSSWNRLADVRRYAWHRALRIAPAFWLCLVVTALVIAPVAAMLSERPPLSVFTAASEPAWRYVTVNAALQINQFGIAGLGGPHSDGVINGSLWTLFYEALCYFAVAALGLLGLLRRRTWLVAAATLALWVGLVASAAGLVTLPADNLPHLLFVFMLGALAALYAHRLPMHPLLALGAGLLTLVAMLTLEDYRTVGAVGFAYVCLWLMTVIRRPQLSWDLSYGTYIWHWPIQVLLVLLGATALGPVGFTTLSIVIALGVAALSWRFVERPALAFKSARWVSPRKG
ncbi:Peptidoglycan/LPS O-acetylase OafA/YrhL, contains acyltransferase and SGNH-hydrolase domains [Quadrisphaera granulorum]|uniref:Peptidoglycan/LPS O-acetylase OafA/YrhL n=1 Tax=Quadrisphaera granulorum TaxID=317664 RepID=A0A316AB26_9ACTN|nr:acyltransferase [Quadrisphaera granulorum]PWJ54619.1 peptidoglycan/LPS O-acetylase OafA/YrhL [Quadrisphaera granulorum]SZE95981.1 Peptidoglycan/LPS O-acetylase OafA/YrhL, contains acyltransferase and SGNH-hydrolase domains [Quadrisphaera granulorum]